MTPEDQSRSEFEAYIRKDCGDLSTFGSGQNMHYRNSGVNHEWLGWQASRRTYRASVLEEAARECAEVEPVTYTFGGQMHDDAAGTRRACVDALRALAAQDKP